MTVAAMEMKALKLWPVFHERPLRVKADLPRFATLNQNSGDLGILNVNNI
jgi:hypothetical protein